MYDTKAIDKFNNPKATFSYPIDVISPLICFSEVLVRSPMTIPKTSKLNGPNIHVTKKRNVETAITCNIAVSPPNLQREAR